MKYTEFKRIDDYSHRVSGNYLSGLGSDFNQTDIKDAFDFMRNYENASRFDKIAMKDAKIEALKILTDFETIWKDRKDEAVAEKKEKNRLRAECSEQAPLVWENNILPAFKNLAEEIETFKQTPGYEYYFLSDEITKQLSEIEKIAGIVRKQQKVYIKSV